MPTTAESNFLEVDISNDPIANIVADDHKNRNEVSNEDTLCTHIVTENFANNLPFLRKADLATSILVEKMHILLFWYKIECKRNAF